MSFNQFPVTILHNPHTFIKTKKLTLNTLLLTKLANYLGFATLSTKCPFLLSVFLKN